MNLNAHVLRLMQIREKLERGEELTEREIAYVKALWARIRPIVTKWVEGIARSVNMSVPELSARLEVEGMRRRRLAAEHEVRMRRWNRAW